MKKLLIILALLGSAYPAWAGYCYTYSKPYYPTYSYSTPYYPPTYSYPVAQYVAYPVPIFGSVYVGPQGATNITTTTSTLTTTAAAAAAAPVAPVVAAASGSGSDVAEILKLTKLLVVQVQDVRSKVSTLETRLAAHEAAIVEIQGLVGRRPASALPGAKAEAPLPTDKTPDAAIIYKAKCFACHQEGSATLVKSSVGDKLPIVLFTDDGKRAAATAERLQAILGTLTEESMPPAKNSLKIPPLTGPERDTLVVDLKTWPRK